MYHSILILLLPLLIPLTSAVPPKSHPRKAEHLKSPIAREIYDPEVQRLAKLHATTRRRNASGKVLVRRKRTGCPAAETDSSADVTATSSTAADASETFSVDPSAATTFTSFADAYPSSTPSASAAAPSAVTSGSTASTNSTGSLMDMLFPVGQGSASWTTCNDSSSALSFSGALEPLTAGNLPATSNSPDGQSSLIANYPSGTVDISANSGFSFYTEGEHNSVSVEGAKEVLFSYSAFFQSGFQFNKGGKMPGLYGGTSLAEAKSCSGGRQDARGQCFSARMMWRRNGAGELYNYFPTNQTGNYCSTPPLSVCDPTYGDSIGRGSFTWSTGSWTTVAQRLKLNDVGASNGEQELFVNGDSVLSLSGLQISVENDTKFYGIMAQTFFGGHDSTWASPQNQSVWFKDWSLAVLA